MPSCFSLFGKRTRSNVLNYRFLSRYCLVAISKKFGLLKLLQSACEIVIKRAKLNNVKTTPASLLPILKDKKVVHVWRRTVKLSSIPCVIIYITAAREQP